MCNWKNDIKDRRAFYSQIEMMQVGQWPKQADSRIAPNQWKTALLCNDVSHYIGWAQA